MASGPDTPKRDPRLKKARDNANGRKRGTFSSDKAARKAVPALKALQSRRIRRKLRVDVDDLDATVEDARALERTKRKVGWSDNAAEHRAASRKRLAHFEEVGGRAEAQIRQWKEIKDRIDIEAVTDLVNEQLARFAAKKKS